MSSCDLGTLCLSRHRPGFNQRQQRYLTKSRGVFRTHNVHTYQLGHADIERHFAFCALLRSHERMRIENEALKREVYARHAEDIAAYNDGKDSWVKQVEQMVLAWYRQQPLVWIIVARHCLRVYFAHQQHSRPVTLNVQLADTISIREKAIAMAWCRTLGFLIGLLIVSADGLLADGYSETWPQWRGPRRDGSVSSDAWPDSLQSTHLVQLWRKELPPSYSGPVVSTDKVFVTYTRDKKYEGVRALDRECGKEVWRAEWEGAMEVAGMGTSMGSWIRATPAYDVDGLFVAGMRDVLVCLDPQTGVERWRADFHTRYGTPIPELGFVSSPLVIGDGVYVQAADSFVRVDKQTGKSVWRCLVRRDVGQGSYSSPNLAVIHGQPQLLVANIPAIAGVDPASGNVLWQRQLDSYDQGCILAPIAYRGGVFTSTRASRTAYYPLTNRDGNFTITDGWKNKLVIYMSSPVVVGDHVYAHLKNGRFACIDLRSGQEKWISGRPFGKYCSMIRREDRILGLTNEGQLLLIHADPDRFVLVDSRTISTAETWGHLAIAGKQIYVRAKNDIAAYRWQ